MDISQILNTCLKVIISTLLFNMVVRLTFEFVFLGMVKTWSTMEAVPPIPSSLG
jgi:hypothetical protein